MITFLILILDMMKKICIVLILIVSFAVSVRSFADNIYFNFDYSVFKGEDDNSILEVYYSVDQKYLTYTGTGNGFEANAVIDITVTDLSDNNILFSNIYKTPSVVTDTSADKINQKLIGQLNYSLPDGKYRLRITGSDYSDTLGKDVFDQEVLVNSGEQKLRVSDIELSTSIKKSSDNNSIFYKNTLDVIPNPSSLYGMNLNELFFYYEIYGLTPANVSDQYDIVYSVNDLNNQELLRQSKRVKRTVEAKADYGKIKIDGLKRGSYVLKITVADSSRKLFTSNEKKFFIFNNDENITGTTGTTDYLKSEYVIMSEDNIDDEFEKMSYVLSDQQISQYEKLTNLDEKKKFLYNFWSSRDVNPGTQVLESKIAYFKRVNEADKIYKEAYKTGWKTDRGRIYILYGKPDDVDMYPFQSTTKSYEIWKYYNVEGGGECVFIELQPTTGNYWLVHSDFRNELRNPEWRTQLSVQ